MIVAATREMGLFATGLTNIDSDYNPFSGFSASPVAIRILAGSRRGRPGRLAVVAGGGADTIPMARSPHAANSTRML
jgi:hypothetical protein